MIRNFFFFFLILLIIIMKLNVNAQQFKFTDLTPSNNSSFTVVDGNICKTTKFFLVEGLQGQTVNTMGDVDFLIGGLIQWTNSSFSLFEFDIQSPRGNSFFQFVANSGTVIDPSIGYFDLNLDCKELNISTLSVDIIQDVIWSTTFKYFSVVKIKNLPENVEFTYDSQIVKVYKMGGNLFRIVYNENFYLFQNLNTWSIDFTFSVSNSLKISVPFKNRGNIVTNEIYDLKLYPPLGQFVLYSNILSSLLSFRIKSNLQNPVFRLGTLGYYSTPRPILGKPNNLTFIATCLPIKANGMDFSLYGQNETQPSFKEFFNFFVNITESPRLQTPNSKLTSIKDNSTVGMAMVTSEYNGTEFKFDFNPFQLEYKQTFTITDFPFGFIGGNNEMVKFGFSLPADLMSISPLNILNLCMPRCTHKMRGDFEPFIILPDTDVGKLEIQYFTSIYIGNLKFLNRIGIKSTVSPNLSSVSFLEIKETKYIVLDNGMLVSGTASEGFWEFVTEIKFDFVELSSASIKNTIKIVGTKDTRSTYEFGDTVYQIGNEFSKLTYPSINLKSKKVLLILHIKNHYYNYLNDLVQVSFLYNDIDITDQSVDNIMFFTFNNIEDYKDLSIGFYLTDEKSLKDIRFENSIFTILNPNYKFAVWDQTTNRFRVNFKVPANTLPGNISYALVLDNTNLIDSNYLSNEYQLRATSIKVDIYGPIVTKIIKQQNGWVYTIQDEVNGFRDGFLIVKGLLDSSFYNITISMSNLIEGSGDKIIGDYKIIIPLEFGIGISNCITQDYLITQASLFDTYGNNNTYVKHFVQEFYEDSQFFDSTSNPFIHFINDSSPLIFNYYCNGELDSSPPNLIFFKTSRSSMDVGSLDRSITFTFQAQDLESGFKQGQNPIVYLVPQRLAMEQCQATPTITNTTTITFSCTIEVPVGFGYPEGFLISVYGFINNRGTYSGFSSKDIKDLNPLQQDWFVSTDFSFNIPIITSVSEFTNKDSTLFIFGKNFRTVDTAIIYISNGSDINLKTITKTYSSFIKLTEVPLIDIPFKLLLLDSNQINIKSNEFLINPIVYNFNYSGPTYTPEPTLQPTLQPTISPLPTNPPQKCLGNPECGGKNKGYCQSGFGCICYSPWYGIDCTSKIIIIPTPQTNTSGPTVEIPIPGGGGGQETNSTEFLFKSLVTLVSIRELGFKGEVIKTFPFDKWVFDEIDLTTGRYNTSIVSQNGNDIKTTNITTIIQWFNSSKNITFAGQELQMNPSSVKFTIEIENYVFSSALNNLELVMFASILSTDESDDFCSLKQFGDTTNGDNSNYIKLQVQDHSMYGRFIKRAVVDDNIVGIENTLLDEFQNTIAESTSHSTQTFIGIKIPHFKNKVIIDPDFFVLLDSESASGENSICSKSNELSASKIAGIVIGSVCFVAVVIISIVYVFIKNEKSKKFKQQIQSKLKQLN
ncbi:hypothetical protein DDB_G0291045 [Dictyostelium discoideum AX4]|uniref:EGF-like domain-containing protein n=1 Tax=Dictyostelium discoideum TaxID=44689 RepID=Q54F75_DICDI|nr:hypothetical protein DDB_G0291045 [Dictyostelium discoideum AX4]EAL61953.1 hypothetical protein DDB_G0291045 [Dictyostelium discoideum AX4]|eukprot:XP_635462.1 hypothetical protein DDB_G0291045 [Dictyostelium discoideum AX4]